jgi:hypothetical protein
MHTERPETRLDCSAQIRLWTRASSRIVDLGIQVEYGRLERPKLGIFDGLRIVIDPAVDFEMQCFLLLHLFGHTVQWVAPGYQPEIEGVTEADLRRSLAPLEQYEKNAARFGLRLLHDCGIADLDEWFFAFAETDWRYVEAFYRTGKIPLWEDVWIDRGPPVEPCEIPPLRPRLVEQRFAF